MTKTKALEPLGRGASAQCAPQGHRSRTRLGTRTSIRSRDRTRNRYSHFCHRVMAFAIFAIVCYRLPSGEGAYRPRTRLGTRTSIRSRSRTRYSRLCRRLPSFADFWACTQVCTVRVRLKRRAHLWAWLSVLVPKMYQCPSTRVSMVSQEAAKDFPVATSGNDPSQQAATAFSPTSGRNFPPLVGEKPPALSPLVPKNSPQVGKTRIIAASQ